MSKTRCPTHPGRILREGNRSHKAVLSPLDLTCFAVLTL